jgi:hypothetical protein
MFVRLHNETVTTLLLKILHDIMGDAIFDSFYLVGGTSLSLRLGHRKSADIDLFSIAPYSSLDFSCFEEFFRKTYAYYDCTDNTDIIGMGRSYYIGNSEDENIKVDLFYHDGIVDPCETVEGIRFATIQDVIAMKVNIISQSGRKKDFWDLHELLGTYTISEMLDFHQQQYEFNHERHRIIDKFSDFTAADEDIDPICLKNKIWELIKLDFAELVEKLKDKSDQ